MMPRSVALGGRVLSVLRLVGMKVSVLEGRSLIDASLDWVAGGAGMEWEIVGERSAIVTAIVRAIEKTFRKREILKVMGVTGN